MTMRTVLPVIISLTVVATSALTQTNGQSQPSDPVVLHHSFIFSPLYGAPGNIRANPSLPPPAFNPAQGNYGYGYGGPVPFPTAPVMPATPGPWSPNQ